MKSRSRISRLIAAAQQEGVCVETLAAAHLMAPRIRDALDLLACPQRLIATLPG
ncbi:hypothetical protein [Pelomicrobium methylotrophicum]|uniref:hypothetical protein n=1 Tax=Pelomicrobium methylotrophicum TaxID=2602750 RepID=UPI001969EE2C|nr:hypothetical protein [Pelomicrobium methylotrophicum]